MIGVWGGYNNVCAGLAVLLGEMCGGVRQGGD